MTQVRVDLARAGGADDEDQDGPVPAPAITGEERLRVERQARRLTEVDLLDPSFAFRADPYEAHIQFSTYCDMSCVMCWDGYNPPTKRLSPEVLARIDEQLAPGLSVITPHDGSEPLALTWGVTRDLARRWRLLLSLVTNGTFLDERRIREALPVTETLYVSLDSHEPGVFEHLRPGASAARVFRNAEAAARAAREAGVECFANVVLMIENAPLLAKTITWLHDIGFDSVSVIQMLDMNTRSSIHDPLLHLSAEYLEHVQDEAVETAERLQMRLVWQVGPTWSIDLRPKDRPTGEQAMPRTRRDAAHRWSERMSRRHPGYCPKVFNRIRVGVDGTVGPCCYAAKGELDYGALGDTDWSEIWNSPSARDLRRAMTTGDVPTLCASCRWHDLPAPEEGLAFSRAIDAELGRDPTRTVEVQGPAHGARLDEPPVFELASGTPTGRRWHLALALGGETEEVHRLDLVAEQGPDGTTRGVLPIDLWEQLRPNVGYWWALWSIDGDGTVARTAEVHCLVRHRAIPRLDGSNLVYPDASPLANADLGGAKVHGFVDRTRVQLRPRVGRVEPELEPEPEPEPTPPPPPRWRRGASRVRKRARRALRRPAPTVGPPAAG